MAILHTSTHSFIGVRRPQRPIGNIIPFRGHTRRGMGDTSSADPQAVVSQTKLNAQQYSAQLQQAGGDLQSLANSAAANAAVAASIQGPLAAAQQQYNTLLQQFTSWASSWNAFTTALSAVISAATLNPVPAISLSQQLTAQITQLQTLQQSIASMKAQIASIAAQNVGITQGSATQYSALAASAYANGDQVQGDYWSGLAQQAETTAANQAITTANPNPPPQPATDFVTWLENNAVWVGIGAAVLFLGPSLIKKL